MHKLFENNLNEIQQKIIDLKIIAMAGVGGAELVLPARFPVVPMRN